MFDKPQKILIKTYCFESGLFYLAKALSKKLEKEGHEIFYIPKAKYIFDGMKYNKTYLKATNKSELKNLKILNLSENKPIENQILKIIIDKNIDTIISFETLMETGQWISKVKSKSNVKIIDVPMIEWVNQRYLNGKSYEIFDEIWCLTNLTKEIFDTKKAKRVFFDFVDENIFYEDKTKKNKLIKFFHAGSLNPEYDSKNTQVVLNAFQTFTKEYTDVELIFTGIRNKFVTKNNRHIIQKNNILDREELGKIYRSSDIILAPSKREGLGLSLYEAIACGCKVITTDAAPMNEVVTEYLCSVNKIKKDKSLIPIAEVTEEEVLKQIIKAYKDLKMKNKVNIIEEEETIKEKTKLKIESENNSLMDAFMDEKEIKESRKLDSTVLAKLKEKKEAKEQEQKIEQNVKEEQEKEILIDLVDEKTVSINIGVIGVGQAGSRIAEQFHKIGYDVGVINTSAQDLRFIDVMPNQKLLLEGSLGGTGKDLDLGREIFADNIKLCSELIDQVAEGNDMLFLAMSGGGGTGSSSVDTMVDLCYKTGMPVGLIYVLPKATEDAQSKKNSIESLARLARMTADDKISCLVVADNARIEQIYGGLGQSQFWNTANNAIVEPIHLFNNLTSQASKFTSLDPSDFGKIISTGDCSVYGMVEVEDYMDEVALAEAMIESLSGNMLAEGFDLSQTRVGGVVIVGSESVLEELPAINIDYAFHIVSEQTDGANIYRGVYSQEGLTDSVRIYTWFAGLGLPQDRIENLKKESQEQTAKAAIKEGQRASAMTLDLEEDKVSSVKDQIHRKIKGKKSGFGKLQGGPRRSLIDRRRKK